MKVDDLLRRAASAQRIAMERALASLELTPAQFAVLQIVADAPGISSAEAARLERLTPPTMSVIVGNLERKGAVVRCPHPKNARIQCLQLTGFGRDLCQKALASVQGLQRRVAAALPSHAATDIRVWLSRVAEIEV